MNPGEEVRRQWVWFKHLGRACDIKSDLVNLNVIVYDENLLVISLNINELLELHNMATCPWIRQITSISIAKLEKELANLKCKFNYKDNSILK